MENNTAIENQKIETGQFNNLPSIMNSAPEILMQNQQSKSRAKEVYLKLNEQIELSGMNDFYDTELAKFVEKGKKTVSVMNERRKGVTQMIDIIKKEFTKEENELKGVVEDAQAKRNSYATEKMLIKQEEDRKAQIKLAKDKEFIEFRKTCDISLSRFFSDCTSEIKKRFLEHFNSLTLENIDNAGFNNATSDFDSYFPNGVELILPIGEEDTYYHLTDDEKLAIKNEFLNANHSNLKAQFKSEIQSQLKELADKVPSKKTELNQIALADANEAERLLKEKAEREKAEADRIRQEELIKRREAETQAAVKAAGEQAAALVDAQAVATDIPKVVESYEISVTNVAGYLMLTQFWFEKEGKNLPIDKFEKFTFARIKAFCENYAKKNDEFVKNPAIIYEPKYKAK